LFLDVCASLLESRTAKQNIENAPGAQMCENFS